MESLEDELINLRVQNTVLEEEVRELRSKNTDLARELQFWKLTAAQREKKKLELMRDINELRLKLSTLRSGSAAQDRKLETTLQSTSQEVLTYLVQASGAVAKSMELAKQILMERQVLDEASPRWSTLGGTPTPNTEKVHRVPPLLLGGQSIQPVVSLSRTMLNSSNRLRSPNQNVSQRAVPMRVLQDVYIPLTRIDLADRQAGEMEADADDIAENSTDDLGLEGNLSATDSGEAGFDDSHDPTVTSDMSRILDDVMEDAEPEDTDISQRLRIDNPLEGPSWLLDSVNDLSEPQVQVPVEPEPDSTTPGDVSSPPVPPVATPAAPTLTGPTLTTRRDHTEKENDPSPTRRVFTPTVRRRRRAQPAPVPAPRPHHANNRILKVVVAKMRLSDEMSQGGGDVSPSKRVALATTPSKSGYLSNPRPNTSLHRVSSTESSPRRASVSTSPRVDNTSSRRINTSGLNESIARNSTNDSPAERRDDSTNQLNDFVGQRRVEDWIGQRGKSTIVNVPIKRELSPPVSPSRNGATDALVIVSDETSERDPMGAGEPVGNMRASRSRSPMSRDCRSRQSRDGRSAARSSRSNSESDDSNTQLLINSRSRRARKNVVYKEKPLNRKLRR